MFDWFVLQPNSIASLAEFALSFVLLLYIVNIKKKLLDTKLFLLFAVTSTVYFFIAFIYFSMVGLQEQGPLYWVHQIALALFQLSIVPFAYYFKGNPFAKEARVVFPLFVALTVVTLYFNSFNLPVNWAFYMLLISWVVSVYWRKAALAARQANGESAESTNQKNIRLGEIVAALRNPPNRNCKAFRAFAKWNVIVVVMWLNVNLMGLGLIPHNVWSILHNSLLLLVQAYTVVNFINYSGVTTTFLAKLVALSLCAVLLMLGIMGFLFYRSDAVYTEVENSSHVLRVLALLVLASTLVIVVVFPIYFKKNLLEPLDQVLDGVKRVNEGDLRVAVPVEANDEIGDLAKHFNSMTGSLRKYAGEMESLVAQRTEELEHSLKNLKAAQAQLIQAEKMASLGELTAGIAHEIQNPLNFVNNFSEVNLELAEELQAELKNGNVGEAVAVTADLEENLQKVVHHGKRADAIVKGMLQHSRVSTGKKEPTDINALCNEYLRLSYHAMKSKNKSFHVDCRTEFDSNLAPVNIVAEDIGRVLLNLFDNAFYAASERAKAENEKQKEAYKTLVSVQTKGCRDATGAKKVEIMISDNGTGIPDSIIGKIFQPFFTTKPTGEGTGLGLSLAYDIVTKSHDGTLRVQNKAGQGAVFTVSLPVK